MRTKRLGKLNLMTGSADCAAEGWKMTLTSCSDVIVQTTKTALVPKTTRDIKLPV